MPPTVVFCTTCKGRLQHLEQTLPQNIADNESYPNAKFVVVNYNSPDGTQDYLHQKRFNKLVNQGRMSVYRFTEPTSFRMAHAKNLAHRLGIIEGASILVNLDADNFTGPGFAEHIAQEFENTRNKFLWSRMKKGELTRGISGRIVVTTEAFLKAGGYDECFETWSPDDKDFNIRLRRLGLEGIEVPDEYLGALPHNDKMRFREYPHAHDDPDAEDFALNGRDHITVANNGKFGMGVVYRNYDRRPIELTAVPTRIFGIGWHKTATTSLHHALAMLGFDSAHWLSAHWAKKIWEEMKEYGRSLTVEQSYALCDVPIPSLYQQLDKAYPNSKFIMTIREEAAWLESAKKHWDPATNKFREAWDTDPFTHWIHKEMYGQKWFDPEIFLARYRRHNDEVKEYFKDRPQDILTFDVSAGHGWYELCGFLRLEVPTQPFPRRNVARDVVSPDHVLHYTEHA